MALFYKLLGALFILAGLPLFWTPVPIGAALILIGLSLLVANSTMVQRWLQRRRRRHPKLDRWLARSEKYLPPALRRILRTTQPNGQESERPHRKAGRAQDKPEI